MLNRIIQFSIKNKIIIAVFTLALIIWGVWSATRLPVDAVPDITNNQVQVITLSPTLASQEVEQFVTFPIEQSLANLPNLEEMRSISRFGLSVITVVFKDNVDIYFARQLINEKLLEAAEKIPDGMGKPELAPVSTGLGDIYQYVIHPKKGAEAKYSAMDLRTMQDWIVARQLYGTPGIAEVNSYGGLLKQYEVALNPNRLKAMDVSMQEIFLALENNNQNTGGAYIDKRPNAYFIRGIGLVNSLDDIRAISVKNNKNGVPVLIRDVAEVRFGNAVRYGALSFNGEKEAVGGVVMMLKGSNSAEVIKAVKNKMETIKLSLPKDVEIESFIDRTGLVNRAIGTVEKNLVEGALIVIFVLVVFLGNIRAGLIVASAIPLSLLFALAMMRLFGVSANLMSLGAIDFGLIVDGAVIIVEATLHLLTERTGHEKLSQREMDSVVRESSGRMMSSAAFGQVIILIVYLPILSLQGIEGKMFTPMAKTVAFAILGALLLSLTYIPMMSALFLPKKAMHKKTFSDRMMDFLQRMYQPILHGAIRFRKIVVGVAVSLVVLCVFLFGRMGGEFIPQLEEGDYAFHCILPQGTSLAQSIETSMQASRIIKQFPEVISVVGRTGSAEIPTDPMPPEASDLIITLKDKKDWTTTKNYKELANLMLEKLSVIPGVFFEYNQPIQMRFNELMTGVRQDVAIKIFGENIDTLAELAVNTASLISDVKGVSAPQVEKTTGLPQITVQYDRARLANYGLSVADVNRTIRTAFAGETAGVVFENERKFDLVVRLDSSSRTSIDDVSSLFISTTNGNQIPLSQVATVAFKVGPAQISREAGKRRIVIGFNVKGRDVQGVVNDIQEKLAKASPLPSGYYYTYGGTFENLQQASSRLMIVVPLALLLIYFMLYLTFRSFKEATLIFTAIPMSAIGGVFALLLRGMPFSISAGVGFIALFGVAVLNGIVLISTFNQLQKEGITDPIARVIEGARIRLRPVLMTATVASLGFLPMAISTGAGAEVQKPLATVVIGGLITATFLTLVVLPCLYLLFNRIKKPMKPSPVIVVLLGLFFLPVMGKSQERISLQSALDTALKNNLQFAVNKAEIDRSRLDVKTASDIPKTGVFAENEDLRPSDKTGIWKIGVSQSVAWPGLYTARKKYFAEQAKYYELNTNTLNAIIRRDVRAAYYRLWYLMERQSLFQRLDSIYTTISSASTVKQRTGDAPGIDRIAAEAKMRETRALLEQQSAEITIEQQQLMMLLARPYPMMPVQSQLEKVVLPLGDSSLHPELVLLQQKVNIANANIGVQQNQNRPEFSGRFFSQRLYGMSDPYSGFSVTAAFPLFGTAAAKNKIRSAQAELQVQEKTLAWQTQQFNNARQQALAEIGKNISLLNYYQSTGLTQAEEIIKAATLSYRSGDISFAALSSYLAQAIDIRRNYLESLDQYNRSAIQYLYYINQ